MNRFFDSTEISPGFPFDQEIEKKCTEYQRLLLLKAMHIRLRYWCQREILVRQSNTIDQLLW
jgi:hypothetical protein